MLSHLKKRQSEDESVQPWHNGARTRRGDERRTTNIPRANVRNAMPTCFNRFAKTKTLRQTAGQGYNKNYLITAFEHHNQLCNWALPRACWNCHGCRKKVNFKSGWYPHHLRFLLGKRWKIQVTLIFILKVANSGKGWLGELCRGVTLRGFRETRPRVPNFSSWRPIGKKKNNKDTLEHAVWPRYIKPVCEHLSTSSKQVPSIDCQGPLTKRKFTMLKLVSPLRSVRRILWSQSKTMLFNTERSSLTAHWTSFNKFLS